MNTILSLQSSGISETAPYKIGYEVGYFLGSNFWLVLVLFGTMVAAVIWFFFFRRKKSL